MAGLIWGALGGTVGKSAAVAPIVGLVGPQAAVTLAVSVCWYAPVGVPLWTIHIKLKRLNALKPIQ